VTARLALLLAATFTAAGCGGDARPDAGSVDAAPADAGPAPLWRLGGAAPFGHLQREAVVIAAGSVLVAGGAASAGHSNEYSVLDFDPEDGTWRDMGRFLGSLTAGNHTVLRLRDGRVHVTIGGLSQAADPWAPGAVAFRAAWLFDPVTSTFEYGAAMPTARMFHRGVLLGDGRVLLVGGASEMPEGTVVALGSAEAYDPVMDTWAPAGSMAEARWSHTATVLESGEVLVPGGTNLAGDFLSSAELFDPAAGSWRETGSMRDGRAWHVAVRLGSGRVLVTGGQVGAGAATASTELYDPTTGVWSAGPPLPRAAMDLAAAALPSGNALVTGGWDPVALEALSTALIYDEAAGAWRDGGTMNEPRAGHSVVIVPDGRAVVVMGQTRRFVDTGTGEVTDGPVL